MAGKRELQKIATQCVDDVIGRIRVAEISEDDRLLVLMIVIARLRFIETTKRSKKGR